MRACVLMLVFDVRFDIAVAYTSVGTVTSLGFKAKLTASFTQQKTCKLTVCANITIVEAFAAVLIEMEIVIVVLYAHRRRFHAIGIALAETATVAKTTHTISTEPTVTAQFIF